MSPPEPQGWIYWLTKDQHGMSFAVWRSQQRRDGKFVKCITLSHSIQPGPAACDAAKQALEKAKHQQHETNQRRDT